MNINKKLGIFYIVLAGAALFVKDAEMLFCTFLVICNILFAIDNAAQEIK